MRPRRVVFLVAVVGLIGLFVANGLAVGGRAAVKSGVTVSGITDRGEVVGTLTRGSVSHGFVWTKGSLKLLTGVTEAKAVNDRGEILGTNSKGQTVLWVKGRAKRIGVACAWALNDRGQVLGVSHPSGGDCLRSGHDALWTNGRTQLLPFAPDYRIAMNDRGQVVGLLPNGAGEWRGGKVIHLGPGKPFAINDRGEILGTGSNGDVTVWRKGIATHIGPPGTPVALNERGQVIGYYDARTPRGVQAFLWSNGTMTDLGRGYSPTAISKNGQVIGFFTSRANVQHGFVWRNGTMTRLQAPKGYAGRPTLAVAINDHNQIVGDDCIGYGYGCTNTIAYNGGPRGFAVLWTLHGRRIKMLQIAKGHS